MKTLIAASLLAILTATALAAAPSVIPAPQKMELGVGAFKFTKQTRIGTDPASRLAGEFLASRPRKGTGFSFKLDPKVAGNASVKGAILLTTNNAKADL